MDAASLTVLHIDDNPFELERVQKDLKKDGLGFEFKVLSARNIPEFLKLLNQKGIDMALVDVHLGETEPLGHSLIQEIRKTHPQCAVVMWSQRDDVATLATSLKLGADDFISKNTEQGLLSLRLYHCYELARLKRGNAEVESPDECVGETLEHIRKRLPRILKSAVTAVHVEGDSGTGKEVVADLFESALPSGTPFVRVNCGAIAPTLLESELFGHVRGAFTGALCDKRGYLESAGGGWIFLDEIASLSLTAQSALLRALETKEILRVGSSHPIKAQFRVLTATNISLSQLVSEGRFRKDLWQRLCETVISLPPLRERPEEIPLLVKHFCFQMPGGPYTVVPSVMEILKAVPWDEGNVRELRNCLRSMTELHVNRVLTPLSIPNRILEKILVEEALEKPQPGVDTGLHSLSVEWKDCMRFEDLTDRLLLELTRKLASEVPGKLSLRKLSKRIHLSRTTLSMRLKGLVNKNFVDLGELERLVGLTDRS